MRSYDLFFTFTQTDIKYYVQVVQQPWYRVLIANVYFWYEMHIFKVPGFRTIEKWDANRKFKKHGFPVRTISDLQGERCYYLTKRDKEILTTYEVDRETYIRLGGSENTPAENEAVKEA